MRRGEIMGLNGARKTTSQRVLRPDTFFLQNTAPDVNWSLAWSTRLHD